MNARAIALQGIGFGVLPMAVQGFAQINVGVVVGGGGAAAGVDQRKGSAFGNYKLPNTNDFEYEEGIRAEIIREDEEILTVIMSAVTSGALRWVH